MDFLCGCYGYSDWCGCNGSILLRENLNTKVKRHIPHLAVTRRFHIIPEVTLYSPKYQRFHCTALRYRGFDCLGLKYRGFDCIALKYQRFHCSALKFLLSKVPLPVGDFKPPNELTLLGRSACLFRNLGGGVRSLRCSFDLLRTIFE